VNYVIDGTSRISKSSSVQYKDLNILLVDDIGTTLQILPVLISFGYQSLSHAFLSQVKDFLPPRDITNTE
jgi:hypothetical protein